MSRTGGGPVPNWGGGESRGDAVRLSTCRGWGLWGGGCAQSPSANRVRMALNPQQDETEAVCLWASGSSDSLYLIFLRSLSNPSSGIWLQRGNTLGIGMGGGEQRVTIMYSVNESFFFFKGKEKLCGCGEGRGTCVLGFPNDAAVLSLSTPEIHTPGATGPPQRRKAKERL